MIEAIVRRDFIGWSGLPKDCAPGSLGGEGDPEEWAVHRLGDEFEPAYFQPLELDGYVRPRISVRQGRVVLFDATHPQLDFAGLMADLGDPDERHDYVHGMLPVGEGEWIFAGRGITVFVNTSFDRLLHVALYAPATAHEYRACLRPHLGKTMRPIPTPRSAL